MRYEKGEYGGMDRERERGLERDNNAQHSSTYLRLREELVSVQRLQKRRE